jgi:hypothetical protein
LIYDAGMRKHSMLIVVVALAALSFSSVARAGNDQPMTHGKIGLGASHTLSGFDAAQFVYDAGKFHVDVDLGFASLSGNAGMSGTTAFGLGGRFWYTINQGTSADFSIGGGVIIENRSQPSDTDADFEAGAQIRAFLVPNVAFTAELGVVVATSDHVAISSGPFGGNPNGQSFFALGATAALGVAYFF